MNTFVHTFSLQSIDLKLTHYKHHKDANEQSIGVFDAYKLHRQEKYEVLFFINEFINRYAMFLNLSPANYIEIGQKIEHMITQAPLSDSSDSVKEWIIKNWKLAK